MGMEEGTDGKSNMQIKLDSFWGQAQWRAKDMLITGRHGGRFGLANRDHLLTWLLFCLPIFALSIWSLHIAFIVGYGLLVGFSDNAAAVCENRMEQVIKVSNPNFEYGQKLGQVASAYHDYNQNAIKALEAQVENLQAALRSIQEKMDGV